jgi:hypothetical protein
MLPGLMMLESRFLLQLSNNPAIFGSGIIQIRLFTAILERACLNH